MLAGYLMGDCQTLGGFDQRRQTLAIGPFPCSEQQKQRASFRRTA
ncbi:MAG: hypothetical protein ACK4ZA_02540 [Tsuneonella troitsensis]